MGMAEIDYGSQLRVGLLMPSGNPIAEPEIRAMLPADVSPLVTRLALRGSSKQELMGMLEQLEPASALLADAGVDVIVFHCTAVSTFAPDLAGEIRRRIEAASGIKCFTTADAIIGALRTLGAKRVTLLTPYIGEVHEREISFLEANGVSVEGGGYLGVNTNSEMARITPEAIVEWASDRISARADACFISCTAIRSAPAIALLEQRGGIPVLTSNQCMVWHLLRSNGIDTDPGNFGQLFSLATGAPSGAGRSMG
jgi:maleate isomerase